MGSSAENGSVVVWDLRNSKAIFNFKDPDISELDYDPISGEPSGEQMKAKYNFIWNTDIATQFLISNDNESNPSMTIWDLRFPKDYILTLSGKCL